MSNFARTTTQTIAALSVLAEVAEAINTDRSLDEILFMILHGLLPLVPGDVLAIGLVEPDHQTIELRAALRRDGSVDLTRMGFIMPFLPTIQEMMRTGTTLYIPEVEKSPLWQATISGLELKNYPKTFLGVPLLRNEQIIGALFVDFFSVATVDEELQTITLAFARYAAQAITHAQQREQLNASEARHRLIASLTSDAIYEWTVDNSHVNWSEGAGNLLYSPQEKIPDTLEEWHSLIHAEDRDRVMLAREAFQKQGTRFEEEYRIRKQNGGYRHVLDKAIRFQGVGTARILGTLTDLTNTYELTDALIESEVRYRALFTHALDAIFVVDLNGRLLDFNPAAEALCDMTYAQLSAVRFHALVAPGYQPEFDRAFDMLRMNGELGNLEIRLQRADGSVFDAEIWGTSPGSSIYQIVARDVSDRNQSRMLAAQRVAELTALSEVTRATASSSDVPEMLERVLPMAMSVLDIPMGCLFLHDPETKLLKLVVRIGYEGTALQPPLELPRSAIEQGRVTLFSPLVRLVEHTPLTQGDPMVSLQMPLVSNERMIGLVIFSDAQLRAFHSTHIYLMEILGRQLAVGVENMRLLAKYEKVMIEQTEALASTESRYESLIEQVPGVVYTAHEIFDGLNFVSKGTEALFGETSNEVLATHSLQRHIKADDLSLVVEQADRTLSLGHDFDAQYRVMNQRKHQERWVHHRARQIMTSAGDPLWLGLITDITRLKELDELKNRFVATVSHELRTPLSVIKLRSATLSNYYERLSDSQRQEMIARITHQADILGNLIEDVLGLAKLDSGGMERQFEDVDLSDIGRNVIEEMRLWAENANIQIDAYWEAQKCLVYADSLDITRIWHNLITNAIKYTNPAGQVKIYTGLVQIDSQQHVASHTLPDHLLLHPPEITPGLWAVGAVEDNGKGISEQDQANIFTRFYRGEAALSGIPGTGLGLSLVKEVLDDYGGHICLQSVLGQGSTFVFWLLMPKHKLYN